jgi:hypothetical protein
MNMTVFCCNLNNASILVAWSAQPLYKFKVAIFHLLVAKLIAQKGHDFLKHL